MRFDTYSTTLKKASFQMLFRTQARYGLVFLICGLLLASCNTSAPPVPTTGPTSPAATEAPTSEPAATTAPTATTEALEPTAEAVAPTEGTETGVPALERTLLVQEPPLEGDDVRAAQQRLLDLGYVQVGAVDGLYGINTELAVKLFQARNSLAVDGVVGPQTWERLFGAEASSAPTAIRPVVNASTGWLLGSYTDGIWVDGPSTAALMAGGEEYTIYSLTGEAGTVTGSKPESTGVPCESTFRVELDPQQTGDFLIGVGSGPDPLPRIATEGDPNDPQLQEQIAALLTSRGISEPEVQIRQVVQVDLDGDGSNETIVNASRYDYGESTSPPPDARAGDYALLAVIAEGATEPIVLGEEYYPEAKEFVAPLDFDLVALLDIDGNGTLEVIMNGGYYEGLFTGVYTITEGTAENVLESGCGV